MNDIEILANIFSKSVLLKGYMLLLNGGEAKAFQDDFGQWYVEGEGTGVVIRLNAVKDIGWARDIVSFTYRGEEFYLQLVQTLDLNQFRFAK